MYRRRGTAGPALFPTSSLFGLIETWRRFRIQDMTMHVLNSALQIRKERGFSYWNSAIVAAARTLGCDRLYTEDLSHGQVVEGVALIDPFR